MVPLMADRPLVVLCHDPLPSPDTSTEQVARTVWALGHRMAAIDLVLPAPSGTAEEIARFYGLAGEVRPPTLVKLGPRFRGGALRHALHDVRGPLWALARRRHALLYTRDLLALSWALATGAPVVLETFRYDLNTLARFAPWRRLCYRRRNFRGVVAHSEMAAASFVAAGIPEHRVLVAHNGFAPESMLPVLDRDAARQATGLPREVPIALYSGHLGARKGTEVFLELAERLPAVSFVLVGGVAGAPESEALAAAARQRRLGNLLLVDRVPPACVPPYLYAADILLIPPTARPLTEHRRTVLPMKTFLYLAAGRPIVAPDLPDLREVLETGRNAVLVPPDDPEAAAAAIARLLGEGAAARRLAENAQADAKRFTWTARAGKISRFLEQ